MNIKKLNFKRITSSGNFIPEIDGLRFIAISSVLVFHLHEYLNIFDLNVYSDNIDYSVLRYITQKGVVGVPLFFVISGFILGLPFAKYHINNEKKVNIKNYFLRRLTRLEPPYLLVMTIMFVAYVFVVQKYPFDLGLSSYFSSIFYSHNYIFNKFPLLNSVAWSLEVEVQFYILAPILAYLFIIKSQYFRRAVIIILIILTSAIDLFHTFKFISLISYLEYFLLGFLLVDLYVSKAILLKKTKYDSIICLILICIIFILPKDAFMHRDQTLFDGLIKLSAIFLLYYYVLFNGALKFLTWRLITNIGGMCYSIYLLHYPILRSVGIPLVKFQISDYSFVNILIYSIILIICVMLISSIFFILIERPCMDKNWYKNIFIKRNKPSLLS
jgi:peptidoglycan/LPS O-acetylase OafA/YrhL